MHLRRVQEPAGTARYLDTDLQENRDRWLITSLSSFQSSEISCLSRKVTTEHPGSAVVTPPLNSNHSMDGTGSTHGSTVLHCSHVDFSGTVLGFHGQVLVATGVASVGSC